MTNERAKDVAKALTDHATSMELGDWTREAFLEAADELERLRANDGLMRAACADAADRMGELRDDLATKGAEIARLREALKPFAAYAQHVTPRHRQRGCFWVVLSVDDVGRAAEVLR